MEPWGILTPHGSDTKTNSQGVAARALAQSQQFTGSAVPRSNAFPIRSLPPPRAFGLSPYATGRIPERAEKETTAAE
jgi:hypothetical protein